MIMIKKPRRISRTARPDNVVMWLVVRSTRERSLPATARGHREPKPRRWRGSAGRPPAGRSASATVETVTADERWSPPALRTAAQHREERHEMTHPPR